MHDLRPILLVNGILLATFGSLMMIPAMVDLLFDSDEWLVFVGSGLVTVFVGVLMWAVARGHELRLTTRHGFLMTCTAWTLLPAFGALPFMWTRSGLRGHGCLFRGGFGHHHDRRNGLYRSGPDATRHPDMAGPSAVDRRPRHHCL